MKRLLSTLIIIFVQSFLTAQVITWQPLYLTENDSVTVTFDATQGDGGLAGFTGDVYAHTGVITTESTDSHDWRHVKTNWGENTPETKLTRIGTDLYEFKILPSIKQYYQLNAGEQVINLAFVFRSADNSKTGKDTDGGDIFLPLRNGVSILQPQDDLIFNNLNDTISITAIGSVSVDTLKLFQNGDELFSTINDTLIYNLVVAQFGKKTVKVIGYNSSGVFAADSFIYIVNKPIQHEQLPNGIVDGINYIDNNTVTLSLFAPNKKFVYVIGDFNNWQIDSNYYMKRTPNDSTYWLTVSGLTPKQEYAFQYFVDGTLRIADPYTEKILDPLNDKYISSQIYPNLKPYPVGKTTEITSILETAQGPFQWKTQNYARPEKTDLVIYELWIEDFLAEHDFKTLTDTLNYLDSLGVNAIELMPVNEFEGNISWGYNPSFYFAVDKYYGPSNTLKHFIDECHKRNIAVIMDIVLNHSFGQSPFVRLYASGNYGPPTADNPWYNVKAPHPFSVGYDFNHESPFTQKLVDRINKFWLTEYKFDGFRFDLSKGFTQKYSGNDVGLWSQYDQSRINILERMANKIWGVDSSAYIILEHFAENSEEKVLSNDGMMLWGNLNYNYNEATMGYNENSKSNFSGISYKTRGWSQPNLVGYMESHDEERLMYKNLRWGNSNGSYTVKDLNIALNRMKLASAFFFTVPGPKMIWQFGELGYDYSIFYDPNTKSVPEPYGTDYAKLSPKPIRWDYLQDLARLNLYKTIKYLTNLKENYTAFKSSNFSMNVSSAMKSIHINDSSMDVTIIGNFGVTTSSMNPAFQSNGTWYDYFSGDSISVSDPTSQVTLEPGEFHIYTNVKLPVPEHGILSEVKNTQNNIPDNFSLNQNYPNPFNPTTTIEYTIPAPPRLSPSQVDGVRKGSLVSLKIYDILGRQVATLINKRQSPGIYRVTFDASNLSSGVYLYRLKAGSFTQSRKMILLR